MIDLPPGPVPFTIDVEQRVDETIPIKCGEFAQDVSAAEAERYADALNRFLDVPENTANVSPDMHRYVRGIRRLNFSTQFQAIRNGGWQLTCPTPGQFAWQMQPIAARKFTAFLAYDDDKEIWFISNLRVATLRR